MTSLKELTPDEKSELAISRRRIAEEERKKVIFDARKRTMGVDLEAIGDQIRDKEERKNQERQRDMAYEQEMEMHSRRIEEAEIQRATQKAKEAKELEEFRREEQHRFTRREVDLNDLDDKRTSLPIRVGEIDSRLGVSSVQIFSGEDLGYDERIRKQREQNKYWWAVQQRELMRKNQEEKDKIQRFAEEQERQRMQAKLENERANLDRRLNLQNLKHENLQQLAEKRQIQMTRRFESEQSARDDINNTLQSDFMTENRITTFSVLPPTISQPVRRVPYHFKGMLPEEKAAILQKQQEQTMQLANNKEKEKKELEAWEELQELQRRRAMKSERQNERERKERELKLNHFHQQQAQDHQFTETKIRDIYSGRIDSSYFNQFNTTTR